MGPLPVKGFQDLILVLILRLVQNIGDEVVRKRLQQRVVFLVLHNLQNICRMKFLRQLSQAGGVLGGEKGENFIFFSHRETS